MEQRRKAKIMIARPGGTAAASSKTYRISLPNAWVKAMGIKEDDREVSLVFTVEKKIVIEKLKE
ncbi:MAG: AbrB/MazE/SpoVT family DNA-binding domain-containing protein [Phascolarctobacterium sp.]|nr:AbrB/MazE/SpoVT family DNA-binding domain-containing protein [Phascolarctobacterium sp.]